MAAVAVRKLAQILVTAVVAAVVVFALDRLLSPAPIPSAPMAAGGMVAFWIAHPRDRVLPVVSASVCGFVVGIALHARSHVAEDRTDPFGEFLRHLLADAGVGFLVAAAAILSAMVPWLVIERRLSARKAAAAAAAKT